MPIYARNGTLLADGAALRGCCCGEPPPPAPECVRVAVALWASSWSIPSGSSTGSGYHSSGVTLYDVVCGDKTIFASRSAELWSEFSNPALATTSSCATPACNRALAHVYNAGSSMEASIPCTASGSAYHRLAGQFDFDDTRTIAPGFEISVTWSLSVTFRALGGGAPAPGTPIPLVEVDFVQGHVATYSTRTDRTWSGFFVDTRPAGASLTDLTAYIYLT